MPGALHARTSLTSGASQARCEPCVFGAPFQMDIDTSMHGQRMQGLLNHIYISCSAVF